jgi:type IV pilus assembly protein PilO
MKLEDFNHIDPKNMGSLPWDIKAVLLGSLFAILVGLGYWFLWKPAMEELAQVEKKEVELRKVFLTKKQEAINLPVYRQQMIDVEKTFGELLRQLPDKSQMDKLLTEINQAGLGVGLQFELFRPGAERRAEFYAEKPISIRVVGSYHELGAFAQNIAKLPLIVTLGEMSITPGGGKLGVNATVRTYRYLDASEIPVKKKTRTSKKKK